MLTISICDVQISHNSEKIIFKKAHYLLTLIARFGKTK